MNESLYVPAGAGKINFNNFFPRIIDRKGRVVIDDELTQFVGNTTHYEQKEPFQYVKKDAQKGGVLSSLLSIEQVLDINQVCAIMTYLGTTGRPLLDITSTKEEKNVFIGYLEVEGKLFALIVEHEFNKYGNKLIEEINLNMRSPDHNEDDPVVVLMRKQNTVSKEDHRVVVELLQLAINNIVSEKLDEVVRCFREQMSDGDRDSAEALLLLMVLRASEEFFSKKGARLLKLKHQ